MTFLGDDRKRQPTPIAMDFNRHDADAKRGLCRAPRKSLGKGQWQWESNKFHSISANTLRSINTASFVLFRVSCSIAPALKVVLLKLHRKPLWILSSKSFFLLHVYCCLVLNSGPRMVVSTQGRCLHWLARSSQCNFQSYWGLHWL